MLQVFLEKSDALLTKMEEYTYNFNSGLTRLDVDIPPVRTRLPSVAGPLTLRAGQHHPQHVAEARDAACDLAHRAAEHDTLPH